MAQTQAEAWIEEGRTLGRLESTRDTLRLVLEARFGALPAALVERIEATDDLTRLQAATAAAVQLRALDEFTL